MPRTLRIPAVILSSLFLWAVWAPAAQSAAPGLSRVQVKGVLIDSRNQQPIVLLEETREGGSILPIWIGPAEAQAIMMALKHIKPPRPMAYDLMRTIIGGLKAKVLRVVITELKEGTFYAQIFLESPERSFAMDSRPSDAIALALRVDAPIFAKPDVLRAAIVPKPQVELTHRERLGLILQEMTPTLARYFGGGEADGLLVSQVVEGAPAARAGIRRGDVLYEVDGEAVSSVEAFEQMVLEHGDGVTVSIRRGAKAERLQLRILPGPPSGGEGGG